jgi:hypothetical protein
MKELTHPAALRTKGFMFLLLGLLASAVLIAENPSLKVAVLLVIVIWSFCRLYYFAFYVIERYIDPQFRFAGLFSAALYLLRKKKQA